MTTHFDIEITYNEEAYGFKKCVSSQAHKRLRKFWKKKRRQAKRKENIEFFKIEKDN